MFTREIRITEDGSTTFFLPEKNEHFHSTHGAVQESMHIFIKNGLLEKLNDSKELSIFEVGFGTGLNALLSFYKANKYDVPILYHGIEKFPISSDEHKLLNYCGIIGDDSKELFDSIFSSDWEADVCIAQKHTLRKTNTDVLHFSFVEQIYDLIYFDAFAPDVQPEIWSEELFSQIYKATKPGGFFLTYSAKGSVKRALKSVGFLVELVAGPPGKREFIRAIKPKT